MQIMFFIEITQQKMRKVASKGVQRLRGGGGKFFDNAQKEYSYEAVL